MAEIRFDNRAGRLPEEAARVILTRLGSEQQVGHDPAGREVRGVGFPLLLVRGGAAQSNVFTKTPFQPCVDLTGGRLIFLVNRSEIYGCNRSFVRIV